MKLSAAYAALGLQLQEAAEDLSANDLRTRLSDAIRDHYRGTGGWGYYLDHFGDAESGHVICCCDSDTYSIPYQITVSDTATKCALDWDNALDVVPRTVYQIEDEEDIEESLRESIIHKDDGWYLMSKDGKKKLGGPYKNRGAAVAREKQVQYFKRAKESGGGKTKRKEGSGLARAGAAAGSLALVESAEATETIVLREARADWPIKLIAPGKGSSAFYPAEVLKRDGPKVFAAGTHVYLNHPTAAEEAARPEGDVANLAGVLTTTAEFQEAGAKGPGLYARMKVFADHAQLVEEKAAHVGMSIRASGNAVMEAGRPQLREGVPVLRELVSAESVDVVTRAGAGGMILTEAARNAAIQPQEQNDMAGISLEEAQKLVKDAVTAATAPLIESNMRHEAVAEAGRVLSGISLPDAAKTRITERATAALPKTAEGALDLAKVREAVVAEAKAEGQYLAAVTGSGRVVGMGAAPTVQVDPQAAERQKATEAEQRKADIATFVRLGLTEAAAIAAVEGRAA